VYSYNVNYNLEYTNPVNMIVEVNGVRARTAAGAEYVGDGSTAYLIPNRLGFSQSLISDNEVLVYLNNIPQVLGVDYTVEPYSAGDIREVIFATAPEIGDQILIAVTTNVQCYINGGQLVFNPTQGLIPGAGDIIAITTWNDTRQQDILTQVFVGPVSTGFLVSEGYDDTNFDAATVSDTPGSFDYSVGTEISVNDIQLGRPSLKSERLWVTLNGRRIFFGDGFTINGEELVLSSGVLGITDVLMVTQFTESIVPEAMAFRIFQDMRGVQATYRITPTTTTALSQPLLSSDDVIYVTNIDALDQPALENNIWGVLTVNGERIMYRYRDTSAGTVSGLLRGTAGTAIADHAVESVVYNLGRGNLMPTEFQNYINNSVFFGDSVTTTFTTDINLDSEDSTIIDEAVEVYVGGILQVANYSIIGSGPVVVEFDTAPTTGYEITVLVRQGVTWYAPGAGTPSDGVALQDTETQAARFLRGL